jgi:L-alanine-DL-glutamate epimerase-like enolase superfamily enzyme
MDTASIDVIWNGFGGSKKIADMAELYEMNVCPHNYNGHLSTFISMQFCALVSNVRMAEIDVDDVPWRDELFTNQPEVENGYLKIPTAPGWGTDVNEKVLREHKWPK